MSDAQPVNHRSRFWKYLAVMLAIVALLAVFVFNQSKNTADAPAKSTTETRPNSEQNTPDSSDGSVDQDRDSSEDTTPSPSGSGANTLLNE
jgi:cytoskeletal protein RodZ